MPSLKRRALNSMLVEYLSAAPYPYSLSVFSEESGAGAIPNLTEAEVMDVLRIKKGSLLYQAYVKAKDASNDLQNPSVLLNLLEALSVAGSSGRSLEISTQTAGSDRFHLEVSLHILIISNPQMTCSHMHLTNLE